MLADSTYDRKGLAGLTHHHIGRAHGCQTAASFSGVLRAWRAPELLQRWAGPGRGSPQAVLAKSKGTGAETGRSGEGPSSVCPCLGTDHLLLSIPPSFFSHSPPPRPTHTARHRLQSSRQLNTWSFGAQRSLQFSCGRGQRAILHLLPAPASTQPFPPAGRSTAITRARVVQIRAGQSSGDLIKGR